MEDIIAEDMKQFVTFKLGKSEYGIDIENVNIIEKMSTITRVPNTQSYIKGVINLRGEIIPIIDLAVKFGLEVTEDTESTRIIILTIDGATVGIRVDSVSEVINLSESSIENVSNFSSELSDEYIIGAAKLDNRIVTLLDIGKMLKISEL